MSHKMVSRKKTLSCLVIEWPDIIREYINGITLQILIWGFFIVIFKLKHILKSWSRSILGNAYVNLKTILRKDFWYKVINSIKKAAVLESDIDLIQFEKMKVYDMIQFDSDCIQTAALGRTK